MDGEDWAILGIAVFGGAGLGWGIYSYSHRSTTSATTPTNIPQATAKGQIKKIGPYSYIAIQGNYGFIWVRQPPATLSATPQGATYPRQCGTVFMQLGPAYMGSPNAFGPGITANNGIAVYKDGTLIGYISQRPFKNAATGSPAAMYGDLSGGTVCAG